MEKESKLDQPSVSCKNKDISKKITNLINQTLANPWEKFWDRIDYIINKVIYSIDQESIKDELIQKKVFDEVCNFLNTLFKEVQIKKFYNNIPKTTLSWYSKKNLWNQLIENIYWKEWKIFYKKEVNWWDCYYRSILLKKMFDKFKAKWLNIQDRIFVYDENRGHSGVIVKFQWKTYLADVSGFNQAQSLGKMISPVDQLNSTYKNQYFTKFSFNRENDFWLRYFNETKWFVDYISNKKINSAAIEFNPRLSDWKEKNVRIALTKNNIIFRIDWKEKEYSFDKKFIFSKICANSHEVLDCLLKWIIADKDEKQEIGLYFDMIRNKINPEKIYEIFS